MQQTIKTIILSAIIGALVGSGVIFIIQNNANKEPSQQDLIKEFYEIESAVHISPHGLRKHMGEDDNIVLVDLRSQEEYEKEHIITAINIPAYATPDKSDYGAIERIVGSFKDIPKDKEIIVYCYSAPCMTGRKIGKMLAENGIYVKHLGIGWNEWRYSWSMWNHEGEASSIVEDYVISGKDPGVFNPKIDTQELPSPCTEGAFDC